MKYKHSLLIIFLIILIDQVLKIYVKLNFNYGESVSVMGDWFQFYFIENDGMAYGMKIMDSTMGKMILTVFRLFAVGFGFWYLKKIFTQDKYKTGLLVCASMILAGAAGNLIDSIFYGVMFDKGLAYNPMVQDYVSYVGIAKMFNGQGYAPLLHGCVVDMFYFPIIDTTLPSWMPIVGGNHFRFFEPIFNFADFAISTGVIVLLVFQSKLLQPKHSFLVREAQKKAQESANKDVN